MVLNIRIKNSFILCLVFCLQVFSVQAVAKEQYVLKFATLMPPDTSWMKIIDAWAAQVEKESKGRLKFKMYPGGVMGDEPDVLRKIRINQLQGGAFTGYGIGRMFSPARVLEMPFLFKNTDESDYVRARIMPDIKKGFRDNGYELLGWMEIGFIHFFSKVPINSMDDVRKRRIWLWQGDPLGESFFKSADISPIPLSIMDVYPQLSTRHGSIDTVYISPYGAIALQWYTKVKYATNIPITNGIGGLIVSNRFFRKLPKDLQGILKRTGEEAGKRLVQMARKDNNKSIEILKESGIQFMWNWDEINQQELFDLRDRAAAHLEKTNYIPKYYFERTRKMLNTFRLQSKRSQDKHSQGDRPQSKIAVKP